jgi:hypothetical protein
MRGILAAAMAAFLAWAPGAAAQNKGKSGPPTRSVEGAVTSPEGQPVVGAVVFLKNLKTLQVLSSITKEGGVYTFRDLNPNVDYELRAESNGLSSPTRNLSSYDTRIHAVVNLKLNKK